MRQYLVRRGVYPHRPGPRESEGDIKATTTSIGILLVALTLTLAIMTGVSSAVAARAPSEIAALITPPLQLGARDENLPVWTLLDGGGAPMGHVFQSVELAPIPGFAGAPINMLIAIDDDGRLLDVRLLDQNEPVFVSGLGPKPLEAFLRQYVGRSYGTAFKIATTREEEEARGTSATTTLDGVAKATASVNIVNETILAATLKVARERMSGGAPKPVATPRDDDGAFRPMTWVEMVNDGLVGHLRLTATEIANAFAGRAPPPKSTADPTFIDLWFADLGLPMVARNLLTPEGEAAVAAALADNETPILVMASGHGQLTGPHFVRNAAPDLLTMSQGDLPVGVRDADVRPRLKPDVPEPTEMLVLRINERLGFDPGSPWRLGLRVVGDPKPFAPPEVRDFTAEYHPPPELFVRPQPAADAGAPPWLETWNARAPEIAALIGYLALLTIALLNQSRLARHIHTVRPLILAVTVVFIGWWGQGQLSMVNLLAVVGAMRDASSLAAPMYDPFTVVLWAFVPLTFVVWGRGTFCGWLCPFGAMQELTSLAARRLGIHERRPSPVWDRRLRGVKYLVLGGLILTGFAAPTLADRLVEVEPFKTAVTLTFIRDWPFIAYAVGLLALSAFFYKAFCRYLCPLGAFMALAGHLRLREWIARRPECGAPCHLCSARCRYHAIEHDGRIHYAECFQCLDCVAIHDDPHTCVPLVLAHKHEHDHDVSGREQPA